MSEQFSLHWDNFHKNMRTGMQSLLESEDLVDVTLAVEGRYLKAHKMVLSLCSPYFRELFQMNPCKHPIVFMKDVSYVALSDLLQFMYQGEVQVAQENLTTFIKTAEALQIKGLTGDSNSQNDETIEQIEEERPPRVIEPIKRTHEMRVPETVQTPPQIKRRFGPPIKRPKISPQNQTNISVATASNVEHPPVEAILTDDHIQTSNNLVQMKVEPSETSSSVQLKEGEISDSRDEYPEDTLIEDETIDIEEDSVLMEATEDDPKPGTSTEDIGDGQEIVTYIRGPRLIPQLVIKNYKYVKHRSSGKSTYWKCHLYDCGVCKARCIIDNNQRIVLRGIHSHDIDKKLYRYDILGFEKFKIIT